MKINKLAALGGIAGTVLMISSWIRYFIMYPDLDRAVIYGCVGFLIIAVSYLWNELVKTKIILLAVEEYLSSKSLEDKQWK